MNVCMYDVHTFYEGTRCNECTTCMCKLHHRVHSFYVSSSSSSESSNVCFFPVETCRGWNGLSYTDGSSPVVLPPNVLLVDLETEPYLIL